MNGVLNGVLFFSRLAEMDSSGIYGGILHYTVVIFLVASALLAFLYFWSKGRLDMDEEPKMQMMKDEEREDIHGA